MKTPICKHCQSPHWTYEGHKLTPALEEVRELGASVLRKSVTKLEEPLRKGDSVTSVTKPHEPLEGIADADSPQYVGRGRPKKYADAAARQRAYRERKSG